LRFRKDSWPSFLVLVSSFTAFYATIEVFLFANRNIFGTTGIGNDAVMLLISFLNVAPAGLFAFSVVSALPPRVCSQYNEESVMRFAPLRLKARVALLYTTFNDFLPEYASYNFEQSELIAREGSENAASCRCSFFILDDSTLSSKRKEVDRFAAEHDRCKVLRRASRKGYKAGAINNWVRAYGQNFDYIFILDTDSQASASAIKKCLDLARRDPRLALIQTKTLTMTSNPSKMTKSSVTIQHAYMAVVQNAMRNMGSSPYYGHNALARIDALRKIGGFIEESNEDYKTLARLHNAGYESLYAQSAVTWEEIPPDYFGARKRALRWARDAVGQLGLLRFRVPLCMIIYLIYGWVTYMANIVMLGLFFLLSVRSFSLQISNMGLLGDLAGILTMSVIVLWPMLSLRVSDPELNVKSIASAVLWGTVFSVPMTAPVSLQIARTTCAKLGAALRGALGLMKSSVNEEFVVTPKVRSEGGTFGSVLGKLKVEFLLGSAPLFLALASGAYFFLLFSLAQILSLILLPLFIFSETSPHRSFRHVPISAKEYALNYNRRTVVPQGTPQYVYLATR